MDTSRVGAAAGVVIVVASNCFDVNRIESESESDTEDEREEIIFVFNGSLRKKEFHPMIYFTFLPFTLSLSLRQQQNTIFLSAIDVVGVRNVKTLSVR